MLALVKFFQPWAIRMAGFSSGLLAFLAMLGPLDAQAVPSFANQTGQSCVACHAGGNFPELTPYGRSFKLSGYTFGDRAMPLSMMGVVTYNKTKNTNTANAVDSAGNPLGSDPTSDFPKDGNAIFNTGSVFLAGKVADNFGGFVQVTYNNYDSHGESGRWLGHTQSDQLDLRYADRIIDANNDLMFGATVNNNPGMQDVWNSSLGGFGFSSVPGSSGLGSSALMLDGGLGQNATGIGAYVYWNKTVYAELSYYRTANKMFSFMSQGFQTNRGNQNIIKGNNPYWRIALTHDWGAHSLMVGTTGLFVNQYNDPTDPSGNTFDRYKDIGVDAQYQYLLDPHALTVTANYVREKHHYSDGTAGQAGPYDANSGNPAVQDLTNADDTLNMFRAKASYVYQAKYGGSLAYFKLTGSTNSALQTSVYDPVAGAQGNTGASSTLNASGNPATSGWTTELFWLPLQYVRVGLQYTNYSQFNGASTNYDGYGRNAKDNNTMFGYVWFAY